jgi:phosphoribosyl 1,2-cyclic phosphodiesterase
VALAAEADVRRLVLFHHEPEHADATMDELVAAAQKTVRARGGSRLVEVSAAQEGMQLTL